MTTDRIMVCAVCGRVLAEHVYNGRHVGWLHDYQDSGADHAAVAVPQTDQFPGVGRCDFCNVDHPTGELPVADFEFPGVPGYWSRGGWAACDECGRLIDAGDWTGLLERSLAARRARGVPKIALLSLSTLYRKVQANATGPVRPYEVDQ